MKCSARALFMVVTATAAGLIVNITVAGAQTGNAPSAPQAATTGLSVDRNFVNSLTVAGMTEIELGNLAADRALDSEVRSFGRMMVKDHAQAGDALKQAAAKLNIPQPTQVDQKHRDLIDRLSKLQGAAFDREYMAAMVKGHEDVSSMLTMRTSRLTMATPPAAGDRAVGTGGSTAAASNAPSVAVGNQGDPLTDWADKVLPTVRQHLERARELQQKMAQ